MLKLNLQDDVVFDEVLDNDLTPEVLRRWLLLDETDPFYPLAIIKRMCWGYRSLIRKVAESDPDLLELHNGWCRKCSGFTFPSNDWELRKLEICHIQSVNAYSIDKFFVTNSGIKLFELHSGDVLTDFEFEYVFGETIVEALTNHKELVSAQMDIVIEQYMSEIVERDITVSDDNSVGSMKIKCLKASGPNNWVYQLGSMKLIDIE